METKILRNYLLIQILFTFFSCTPERTFRKVASDPFYLEKQGKLCNLYFKNAESKFVLIADSVKSITTLDSVVAYSRIEFSTYPDMIITRLEKNGKFSKIPVKGLEFEKVFPTFFSFPVSTETSHASEMYDFLGGEVKVNETDIVNH